MILPRFLSPIVALGCAVLALSAVPRAHAQLPPEMVALMSKITLTDASLDKLEKTTKALDAAKADPAFKTESDAADKDTDLQKALMAGDTDTLNNTFNTKYPKMAAVFKSGGMSPGEAMTTLMVAVAASTAAQMGGPAPDDKTAQANIAFAKTNTDRIGKIMASMH